MDMMEFEINLINSLCQKLQLHKVAQSSKLILWQPLQELTKVSAT